MAIDRNARWRLHHQVRADRSLTHAARNVIGTLLTKHLDMKTGRAVVAYDTLAESAGCDRSTVARALDQVCPRPIDRRTGRTIRWASRGVGRYLTIHQRREIRPDRHGRRKKLALPNVYIFDLPSDAALGRSPRPESQDARGSRDSSDSRKEEADNAVILRIDMNSSASIPVLQMMITALKSRHGLP